MPYGTLIRLRNEIILISTVIYSCLICFITLLSSYDAYLSQFTHFYFIISSGYPPNEYQYNIILIEKKIQLFLLKKNETIA